jgi:DNA gyrase subunit A
MRYTEAKLTKIAEELLVDLDKETVKFLPNYDNSSKEPIVLPAKIPNLLINGSAGIAVGMATNIPPHNISEVIGAIVAMIDNPQMDIDELMNYIKGPDFPTAAQISGRSGIISAYKTGRGLVIVKAVTDIEEKGNKKRIVVSELPYQVNKALLIESIADLVRDKKVEGISDIRDESDRKGIRVVIDIKQNHNPELVLNQLYKHTSLRTTFGVIMIALVAGQPKILNLKEMLHYFILHRKRVVTRRTQFELKKAERRAHILVGLKTALANVSLTVKLVRSSRDVQTAKLLLMKNFKLSEIQAMAILDMKLQRFTSLETSKIVKEHQELLKLIAELREILSSEAKIFEIIKKELLEIKEKYGDERRTKIVEGEEILEQEDLIKKEDVVVTITNAGYIKRLPVETYKQQGRGGKGVIATGMKEEDFVEHLFVTSTHSYILFFTDKGKVHWLKAYRIPEASRYSKGSNIVNLLKLKDETITALIPIKEFKEDEYLVMVTEKGLIKKTSLMKYSRPRKKGIIALKLRDKDKLVTVKLTNGDLKLIIATENGQAVKFEESKVRSMGRTAAGVRGIRLVKDKVVGMEIAYDEASLLTVTENGYGKRTEIGDYRLTNRGGKGVINIKTSSRNGKVIGIRTVMDDHELMFITKKGMITRVSAKNISTIGRNTQGVRLMKLKPGDKVMSLARVINND